MNDLQALLAGIKSRKTGSRWGIGTAAMYLASIAPCFDIGGGGFCPSTVFEKHSPADWLKALKEAEERLTYCESDNPLDTKAIRHGSSVPGAILEFDHIITTTKKDRDGDILEAGGMSVDKNMPLLWQHVPMQPLGPFLGTTTHDTKTIAGKSAILDTAFGRDVAVLTEGGALRISQGFKAYEFEPLIKKDAADKSPYGFHIKKGDIMEVSLVSVPANTDAVITAHSRQKLFHPLVSKWAKSLFDARDKSAAVGATINPDGTVTKDAKSAPEPKDTKVADQKSGDAGHACTCSAGKKADEQNDQKSVTDQKSTTVTATKGTTFNCPKCNVGIDLTGVPDGVNLDTMNCPLCNTPIGSSKAAGELSTKEGRVLSRSTYQQIKVASDALAALIADYDSRYAAGEQLEDVVAGGSKSAAAVDTKSAIATAPPELLLKAFVAKSLSLDTEAAITLLESAKSQVAEVLGLRVDERDEAEMAALIQE